MIWLPEDIAAISEHADQPLKDAIALAIRRTAAKRRRGRRFRVTLPRLPELDAVLDQLRTRKRKADVETVLVNSYGKPWTGDGLASSFHDARRKANGGAGIYYVERDR